MASTPTFQSNPYADFDPSQWSNPYSNFQNSAIPFPASYSGWPTDASGNPIQPLPGMTLNSTPQQPQARAAAPQSNIPQFLPTGGGQVSGGAAGGENAGMGGATGGTNFNSGYQVNPAYAIQQMQQAAAAPPPQAAPAAQAASTPLQVGMPLTSQQYLQLRANPGHVTTPGATVPQAGSSATPGPGMLQQFLANWNPAQSGPGSGFQQAFSKALKGS
jgi:hypothetical protein